MKSLKEYFSILLKKIINNSNNMIFFLFILLVIMPSFFISTKAFLRSFYPILIICAILNHRRSILFVLAPFYLSIPSAIYFWFVYHAPVNVTLWLILFGTNVQESLDYLNNRKWALIAFVMLQILFFIFCFRKVKGPVYTNKRLRWAIASLAIVPFVYFGSKSNAYDEIVYHFSASYPWYFLLGYHSAKNELRKYKEMDFSINWIINAKQEDSLKNKKQVFVLVIGETARRDRQSLYGYKELTNPKMTKLKDAGELLVFKNFITLHPHTAMSVPTIITKHDGLSSIKNIPPSFIQVFKDAGFKTYWLSNQAAMGPDENKISIYARKSDYFHSLHAHSLNLPWAYDGELLPEFEEKLKNDPEQKKFFVLHLQGSHYGFKKRYPKQFEIFNHPYDNTILYTDFFLNQVIEKLKSNKQISGLIYLSDHGLQLGECGKETHFDNKESFEIPFWIWLSKDWKNQFLEKYSSAAKHLNTPMSTVNVLDSLIDMAGISYVEFEDQKSLFRSTFKEQFPRYVRTYSKIVDYDHGHNSPDCHLESDNPNNVYTK